jgi:type I restriction enzyme, S subunit
MSVPAYAKYKDSGVAWLGAVPRHWPIVHSRRYFALRKDRASEGDQQLTASQKWGVIYQSDFMEREGQKVVQVILNAEILKKVKPNDFVISMRSFQGGIEWCGLEGSISSAYVMLIPNEHVVPKFFRYLFKSKGYIQALQSTSNLVRDGQALRYENFVQVKLPLPAQPEQTAIADFLDRETAKIDRLVAEQERLIALLKEKRQAVISQAVTKGLNPNAPMKDSGIEWLGQIPAHWRQTRTSRQFKLGIGQTILSEALDQAGDWPVYSATEGDHYFGHIFEPNLRLSAGDLIIPARGNSIGHVKIANEPCTTTQTTIYAKIVDRDEVLPTYAYWFMRGLKKWLFPFVQTAIPQITTAEIGANVTVIPAMVEQNAIVDYVKRVVAQYEGLIAQAQSAIALLQERRAALISAAVTGKIDVRGLVAIPDELEAA